MVNKNSDVILLVWKQVPEPQDARLLVRPCLKSALEDTMDSNDTTILNQSGAAAEEGEWLMTDSATGTFVPSHGEGSNVVAAVSSEMAIPYSVKARQRKTIVPKVIAESIACHDNCIGYAGAWLAG